MRRRSLLVLALAWCADSKPALAQWPFSTGSPVQNFGSPAVADIDGDGHFEVLFTSWDGHLYCVEAGGMERWRLRLATDSRFAPQVSSSPALAELDGNPATLEIVVGSPALGGGALYVVSSSGAVLDTLPIQGTMVASPLVVDADGNGEAEVYIGQASGNPLVHAIGVQRSHHSISLTPLWSATMNANVFASAAAADFDRDGDLEIVLGGGGTPNSSCCGGETIHLYSHLGVRLWSFSTEVGVNHDSPVIADLDGNGELEVLIASMDGYLYCLDGRTGVLNWKFQVGLSSVMHTPAVADLVGDDALEIVVGSQQTLRCLDMRGQQLWSRSLNGSITFSCPSIGDLDGNERLDVVIGTSNPGSVVALSAGGALLWSAPQPGTVYSSPTLVDLDQAGRLEVCFGIYNSTFNVLDSAGQQFQLRNRPTHRARPWLQFRSDPRNRGFMRPADAR